MSRAKQLIEMMCPAPAVEPKPGVKPAAPGRTAPRPAQPSRPNPFRRREIRPGEAPRPKAAMESILEGAAKKAGLKQPAEGKAPEKAYSKAKAAITTKTSVPSKGDLKKPADGAQPQKAFKKGK
jgi:hypothetical protein